MKHKHGEISIIMAFFLIAATVFIIWTIFGEAINKAFDAVINPLKDEVGIAPDCEVLPSFCQVQNAPCSCHTAESKADPDILPETCTGGQYCYDGTLGCDGFVAGAC